MDKSRDKGEANHTEVHGHKARIVMHPGEQYVTYAREKNRGDNDRPRSVAINEIADERRFNGALGPRE
jgi:hypothetical protein